jgi:dTMP kinase
VVFLSLSSEVAAQRGGYGQERYEKEEMQKRVREVFSRLQQDPRDAEDWHTIDASGDVGTVAGKIWDVVQPVLRMEKGKIREIL